MTLHAAQLVTAANTRAPEVLDTCVRLRGCPGCVVCVSVPCSSLLACSPSRRLRADGGQLGASRRCCITAWRPGGQYRGPRSSTQGSARCGSARPTTHTQPSSLIDDYRCRLACRDRPLGPLAAGHGAPCGPMARNAQREREHVTVRWCALWSVVRTPPALGNMS